MDKKIWVTSTNEERWGGLEEYESKEEAIKYAAEEHALEEGDRFFVGTKGEWKAKIDADVIIENITEDAYGAVGDVAEDWLSGTTMEQRQNLEDRLNKAFQEWLKETNNEPTFFPIENITKHFVGEKDE